MRKFILAALLVLLPTVASAQFTGVSNAYISQNNTYDLSWFFAGLTPQPVGIYGDYPVHLRVFDIQSTFQVLEMDVTAYCMGPERGAPNGWCSVIVVPPVDVSDGQFLSVVVNGQHVAALRCQTTLLANLISHTFCSKISGPNLAQ